MTVTLYTFLIAYLSHVVLSDAFSFPSSIQKLSVPFVSVSSHKRHDNELRSTTTDDKIGWDSHKAIDAIPETLVRTIDGNDSIRRKFEVLCRSAQV